MEGLGMDKVCCNLGSADTSGMAVSEFPFQRIYGYLGKNR